MPLTFQQVGVMRVKVTPLGGTKLRIDYMGILSPDDTTKFTEEPVFWEEIDLEDKVSAVSQLVVGEHASVQGSLFLLDSRGLRHFRVQAEPGMFNTVGKEME